MQIMTSGSFDKMLKLAIVNLTPEERARLRGEGTYFINDPEVAEPNVLPGVKDRKRDLKALGGISLPRIIAPSTKDIVEIDGHQYYIIDIAEPQPKKNPEGTIYLMNLETGEPENKPFLQYADRIKAIKRDRLKKSLQDINSLITRWNMRIENINDTANPTTWKGQLFWAKGLIDERVSELEGQIAGLTEKLDRITTVSPTQTSILDRIKGDITGGRISNQADLVDHVMYVNEHDPDSLQSLVDNPSTPEPIKVKVNRIVEIIQEEARKRAGKERASQQERQDRMNESLTEEESQEMLSPGQVDLVEMGDEQLDDVKGVSLVTDKHFSPKSMADSIRATLSGIRANRDAILRVKTTLDEVISFIDGLAKGERSKETLMNTDRGVEIKAQITRYIKDVEAFQRGYKVDLFVNDPETGKTRFNRALIGHKGGTGNIKVIAALNQIVSVLRSSLKTYASPAAPVPPGGETSEVPENATDYQYLPQDLPTEVA